MSSFPTNHFNQFPEYAVDDDDDEFDEGDMDSGDDNQFIKPNTRSSNRSWKWDKQDKSQFDQSNGRFRCECGKSYKEKRYLRHHEKWECGNVPSFRCHFCSYTAKRRNSMKGHLSRRHNCYDEPVIHQFKHFLMT